MARRPKPGDTNQIELYRRDGTMRLDRTDWHTSLSILEQEPWVSASVQMDLGIFYTVTEFVRAGSFVVGHPGAAKADW